MKALVIDSSITKLTIAAKNDEKVVTVCYDIGMKQSETLLPAIQYVLEKTELLPADLDYTAITEGPGSFTGLRLGFSALKAFQAAFNIPIYGISTLKAYAYPFFPLEKTIVSVIDAKKERFYAAGYKYNLAGNDNCFDRTMLFQDGDYEPKQILDFIKEEHEVFVAGVDCKIFMDAAKPILTGKNIPLKFLSLDIQPSPAVSLFVLAEEKISNGDAPLKDFAGPVYIRASEAEVKFGNSMENKSREAKEDNDSTKINENAKNSSLKANSENSGGKND